MMDWEEAEKGKILLEARTVLAKMEEENHV